MDAKNLLLSLAIAGLAGCGYVNAEIPENIKTEVVVSGQTQSTITHEVAISADFKDLFLNDCQREADGLGLLPGSLEREAYINNCVSVKSNEFIAAFMAFIQSQQGENEAPAQ